MLSTLIALLSLSSIALSSPVPATQTISKRYTGVKIQSYRNGLCLQPLGRARGNSIPIIENGTPVGTVDCAYARTWDISPGSGSVILSGTNFALDAGTGWDNNEKVKVWQSYPGLFQQTWYLTDDDRIAITGGNQCLDEDYDGPQTYQCTTGNTNQVWYVLHEGDAGATPVPLPSPATTQPANGD
ncbi:hypothetical protein CI109_106247 [Kwoniella shandongensis]|uniref:Ricin B lectin domain-containing protein n=1 Tax=Kwoniella shandongensis TaxID=1734106 RepID=A0A5M6BYE8_9TREE|nr:uncharacterized protein CI109_003850 [Kwoniella shandongensis]KAA5527878.1 hypothetical protein CI109_003850 [Kwoniella shandongensis]